MKKWTQQVRRFLNSPKSGCLGAVSWQVACYPERKWNRKDKKWGAIKGWTMNGDITINDDAQTHYVERKAHLRPLYAMQKELNDFIYNCETALKDAEERNAKS